MKGLRLAGAAAASVLLGIAGTGQAAAQVHVASAGKPAAAVVTNGQWSVYHHDDAHTGFDATQPTASGATAGWVSGTFDANVYAEPLVYQGVVYVATLNNTVYALNQADGTTLWFKNLGAPTTGGWICGNVSPQGILGTPVIDTSANRIYVAAFLSTHVWTVFGLDLANSGNVVLQTTLPTYGGALDWKIQQERGALALANGYVYVPIGGRDGDCNDGSILFQGWVLGVPTSGSGGTVLKWNTGGSGGSSVWAPGGVAVDDSTGKVFASTGNGNCPSTYDNYNDAVVRLSASLALEDYFAPFDWHSLSCNDTDVGSASPVLISPTLAFQAGKPGNGYLVNPQSLGGIDGQLYPAKNTNVPVCLGNGGAANYGAYAYAAPYVYLECEGSGITGLKVDTASPSFSACDATCGAPSWNAGSGTYGSPIVAGGVVWAVNTDGAGLTGFDATTGSVVFQSAAFGSRRFSTPSEAGGQIFVASDNVVREFNMVKACANAMLGASPGSPQTGGTPVTLTGSVSNCPSPQYRFWIQPPGGVWGIVQDYGPTSTYNWTSTGTPGTYRLEVDVRNAGSTLSYDSVANISYTITSAAACLTAGLGASPSSPQAPGTQVTWTGSSSGCPNPRYRFWELDPGARWSMVQDYGPANTYLWHAPSLAGGYRFEVDVRDASESTSYDVVANANYTLQAVAACSQAGLGASPPSPGAIGAGVTLTGSSSSCPHPVYRFWVRPPGGAWQVGRDYAAGNSWLWTPANSGSYGLEVDVRDASESTVYDTVANLSYLVNGCTGAQLAVSPVSPGGTGVGVTMTGSSASCPNPVYRFWVRDPGSRWSMVQDYSPAISHLWAQTGLAGTYALEVDVRDASETTSYDSVFNLSYVVSGCSGAALSANPGSPQAHGTPVTLSGSASCLGTPTYRFWVRAPGGAWQIVRDYSTAGTFTWTPASAGTYSLEVDVRDQGATATYETVANISFNAS